MSRQRRKKPGSQRKDLSGQSTPWYKRTWFVISSTATIVAAVVSQGPTILKNLRVLPTEVRETTNQFQSWAREDVAWTGTWSSFPEGIVDMADMNLSNVDLRITIKSSQGNIEGTIATKKICKDIPFVDFILLRGDATGTKAKVVAWDIVQGHKTDFAELALIRDGNVLTVAPTSGRMDWFPVEARIGKHPSEVGTTPDAEGGLCSEERKAILKKLMPRATN